MGLFDDVTVDDSRVVCAAGHRLHDLQTKDLECSMLQYRVHQDRLYLTCNHKSTTQTYEADGETLIVTTVSRISATNVTATALVYDHCGACSPILTVQDRAGFGWDMVDEHHPWCEYQMTFEKGRLVAVVPITIESRDSLRAKLVEQGRTVLADDNPIAVRHLEIRRKANDANA